MEEKNICTNGCTLILLKEHLLQFTIMLFAASSNSSEGKGQIEKDSKGLHFNKKIIW